MIAAGDMSGDITSAATQVEWLDNLGIQAHWSGTSPAGEIIIEGTNDQVLDPQHPLASPNWVALDFGQTISITGNTGDDFYNINQFPFTAVRVRYVRTSGTGTLVVKISAKML